VSGKSKNSAEYRRFWCKVYLAIDAETLDVRAVEMTDHRQGDAAQAEGLLAQVGPDEQQGVSVVMVLTRRCGSHCAAALQRKALERQDSFHPRP
jgi:hypothetical protein